MRLRVLARLVEIERVLVRHRLDDFVRATHLYRPLRFVFFISPWTWFQRGSDLSRGARLRLALIALGPIFVKFGQALSTRRDLLPADIADELAKLQDNVPPFPGAVARAMIECSYGAPLDTRLRDFEETPLAAASIAQVHGARLADGREVIVKVLRPGMKATIELDIEVLYTIAAMAERWWAPSRRLKPMEIVREYEKTILDELDLMREAANASQLKRNFAGSELLYVPEVHWDHCRTDVMVMERIHGVPISDMAALRAAGTDIARLAENGVRIFFTEVFRHNFFHGDMHPGNIFVLIGDPRRPRYAAVDFGIVGTLDPRDQHYLAENFLAVFDRDYRRVAQLHLESGWVPAGTRIDEMESAVRTVCEPIFDRPLKDISFGRILLRLFEISRRFNMQIQPQLLLLQKTLLNVEGLGRELYPELDIWSTASPILREWMRERVSVRALMRSLRAHAPELLEALRGLPALIATRLRRDSAVAAAPPAAPAALKPGAQLREELRDELRQELRQELREERRARTLVTVGAALLLGGLIWLAIDGGGAWPGWVLVAGGAIASLAGSRR